MKNAKCPDCGSSDFSDDCPRCQKQLSDIVADYAASGYAKCPDCKKRHGKAKFDAPCPACAYQRHLAKKRVSHSQRKCAYCLRRFTPKRSTAKYCSSDCRLYHWRETKKGPAAASP